MNASDIRPTCVDVPRRVLAVVVAVLAVGLVWVACRIIVPRYEASLMDAGFRPSLPTRGLLVASSAVARSFAWVAPILGAFFAVIFWPRGGARGIPRE